MSEDLVVTGAVERRLVEQEHHHLQEGLGRLHDLIVRWPWLSSEDALDGLVRELRWAQTDLEPHLAWERQWVYPELDRQGGSPFVTCTVRFCQQRLLHDLGELEEARRRLTADWSRQQRQAVALALATIHAALVIHIDGVHHLLECLDEPRHAVPPSASPTIPSGEAHPA
ncbi:MAG: hypothetical protein ACHQZR_01915 [Candidatus Limnocylindrales bacterium]